MKALLLLFFSLGINAITCPPGYTLDSDGNCYLWQGKGGPMERNNAYQKCAQDNAYIIDIPNAFQNSKFAIQATFPVMWMGLTCLSNSIDSCVWDNGKAMNSRSYNNFDGGSPNIELGACVYMDVSTEKWRSGDCSTAAYGYGCKFTSGITIPSCNCNFPMCSTFRGKCYRLAVVQSIGAAATICPVDGSDQGSIHSDGENSLISGMAINYGGFGFTVYLGIQDDHWIDGTPLDYTNYASIPTTGQCKSMINGDRDIPNGKWINTPCSSNQALTFCVKAAGYPGTGTTMRTIGTSTVRTSTQGAATIAKTTSASTTYVATTEKVMSTTLFTSTMATETSQGSTEGTPTGAFFPTSVESESTTGMTGTTGTIQSL